MDHNQIKQIIETYELPQGLEERILSIALSQIEERDITDYREAYTYLAELVDKFTTPRTLRGAVKLDARPDPGFRSNTRDRYQFFFQRVFFLP